MLSACSLFPPPGGIWRQALALAFRWRSTLTAIWTCRDVVAVVPHRLLLLQNGPRQYSCSSCSADDAGRLRPASWTMTMMRAVTGMASCRSCRPCRCPVVGTGAANPAGAAAAAGAAGAVTTMTTHNILPLPLLQLRMRVVIVAVRRRSAAVARVALARGCDVLLAHSAASDAKRHHQHPALVGGSALGSPRQDTHVVELGCGWAWPASWPLLVVAAARSSVGHVFATDLEHVPSRAPLSSDDDDDDDDAVAAAAPAPAARPAAATTSLLALTAANLAANAPPTATQRKVGGATTTPSSGREQVCGAWTGR